MAEGTSSGIVASFRPPAIARELEAEWVDITNEFETACSDLNRGELLHDEMFGLFEAMSAIEMMDPKMDAGMMCNRVKRKIRSFRDSIAAGTVRVTGLTNEERVGIIDDTLCCLMSWLDGHTLAQTLFTNLYLHEPDLVEDRCLKGFCLLILAVTDTMRTFITKAEVFEEEDFQSALYSYKLSFGYSDAKICSMVREQEDELSKRMKHLCRTGVNSQLLSPSNSPPVSGSQSTTKPSTTSPNNSGTSTTNSSSPPSSSSSRLSFTSPEVEREWNVARGLLSRLRLLRSLLMALLLIIRETSVPPSSKEQAGGGSSNGTSGNNRANPHLVQEVTRFLQLCLDNMAGWRETVAFGVTANPLPSSQSTNSSSSTPQASSTPHSPPESCVSSVTCEARADYPTIMGFDPLINQRLLPATFPRYTRLKPRDECVNQLETLIRRLVHVVQVKEAEDFQQALDFFCDFSGFPAGTCVLSRSVLQLTYVPHACTPASRDNFMELMREASNRFIRPPVLNARLFVPTNDSRQAIESFFVQSLRPMLSLLQIQGHNRARQREKLAQILDELTAFQSEGEKVDLLLNSMTTKQDPPFCHMGFFSTWVLYHVIRVMIQYLNSGFELELYADHELPYIYWYLYEFLYGWLISTLTRASNLSMEQINLTELVKAKQSNKKVKNNKKKGKEQRVHGRQVVQSQALQQLCGGMFKAVMAFRMQGRLRQPLSHVSSERLRYEHRFLPFYSVIAPPVMTYNHFRDMSQQVHLTSGHSTPQQLFAAAFQCFDDARRILAAIPDPSEEMSSCLKVAKTNMVVTKLLASGITTSKSYPEFDFSVNKIFPIIRAL